MIVENLTFMLAQHVTAVKDVIFFWPITFPKIFNPSSHMTRRAIKIILQSETTVKSSWHESEDPNGLDQRLSSLGSQRFVPIKKVKKRFLSQNLPRKNKRKPLEPGYKSIGWIKRQYVRWIYMYIFRLTCVKFRIVPENLIQRCIWPVRFIVAMTSDHPSFASVEIDKIIRWLYPGRKVCVTGGHVTRSVSADVLRFRRVCLLPETRPRKTQTLLGLWSEMNSRWSTMFFQCSKLT